jgi:hypothetical protein
LKPFKTAGAVLAIAACTACSFAPSKITPPESVFSDTTLGSKRKPAPDPFVVERQRLGAQKTQYESAQSKERDTNKKAAIGIEISAIDSQISKLDTAIAEQSRLGIPLPQEPNGLATDPGVLAGGLETDLLIAFQKLTVTDTSEHAEAFLDAGISLVRRRCSRYFQVLGLAAQKLRFANKELALTTGVTAALQGLTGAAAKDIAITGALLGFWGASNDTYGDVYLYSPDIAGVGELVAKAQEAVELKIKAVPSSDLNKKAAFGFLESYEKTCEVQNIRSLVNDALKKATPIAGYAGESTASVEIATRAILAAALGVRAITDDQLTALYWIAYKGTQISPAPLEKINALFDSFPSPLKNSQDYVDLSKKPIGDLLRATIAPLLAGGSAALDKKVLDLQTKMNGGTPSPAFTKSTPFSTSITVQIK